ncbi:MAG: methyl-accepting chemotaxis protein [Clostridium sp.]|nr:methyl-accepting chemotaxis protein [Clostridium sp.]
METQQESIDKKSSLGWFLHKRFITIGFILGILMFICAVIIIRLAFLIRDIYRETGDSSKDWLAIAAVAIGILAVAVVVAVDLVLNKMAVTIIDRITIPLGDIGGSIQDLSKGKLDTTISYNERDEFKIIADSTLATIAELKLYIDNISETLNQMSDKNMNLSVDVDYEGDFLPIKNSIETIIDSMNALLGGMQESMNVIREGARNMTETASSLAEGAATQTNEIQELFDHINQVTEDIVENANNAQKVAVLANESMSVVEEGNNQMQQLLEAMEIIKKQSDDIADIIQVINSISEQTKLLSLNASIEAARAGEQGKGFAVVADEIGKLAGDCGNAANTTNELISKTIQAVNAGGSLADETAGVLKKIVDSTAETTKLVEDISTVCSKEEGNMKVIIQGIERIEDVVSGNAASSEESAAVSEELLAMVENLEGQIREYQLR